MKKEERGVMTVYEAEELVGEQFNLMEKETRPTALCAHKVWVVSGYYEPQELEAVACLTREYRKEPKECEWCEEEREEDRGEKRKGKKGKKSRDDY